MSVCECVCLCVSIHKICLHTSRLSVHVHCICVFFGITFNVFLLMSIFCVCVCVCVHACARVCVCSGPPVRFAGDGIWWWLVPCSSLYLSLSLCISRLSLPALNLPITPRLSLHLQPSPPPFLHLGRHAPFSLNGVQTFGTYWTGQWEETPQYTKSAGAVGVEEASGLNSVTCGEGCVWSDDLP